MQRSHSRPYLARRLPTAAALGLGVCACAAVLLLLHSSLPGLRQGSTSNSDSCCCCGSCNLAPAVPDGATGAELVTAAFDSTSSHRLMEEARRGEQPGPCSCPGGRNDLRIPKLLHHGERLLLHVSPSPVTAAGCLSALLPPPSC